MVYAVHYTHTIIINKEMFTIKKNNTVSNNIHAACFDLAVYASRNCYL